MLIRYGHEIMNADSEGRIGRPEIGMSPSDSWRIAGAVTRNNFGAVTRRYSVAEVLALGPRIPWKFKNGKQRTFMRDLDHGAPREWRSPGHCVL